MKNKLLLIMIAFLVNANAQIINYPYLNVIKVPEVWQVTQGDPDVVVAVFGHGVDITHPDLNDNIFINEGEIPGNGIDDDGNGYVDDINGWNFIDDDSNVLPQDDSHETSIAGIISPKYNQQEQVVGIAPNCKILPIKFYYTNPDLAVINSTLIAGFNYVRKLQLQFPSMHPVLLQVLSQIVREIFVI